MEAFGLSLEELVVPSVSGSEPHFLDVRVSGPVGAVPAGLCEDETGKRIQFHYCYRGVILLPPEFLGCVSCPQGAASGPYLSRRLTRQACGVWDVT